MSARRISPHRSSREKLCGILRATDMYRAMRARRIDRRAAAGSADLAADAPSHDALFESVFLQHRDDVWRYCTRRLDAAEVNDAVADVFVVVWRRLDDMPPDDARPWIFGVARNVVRNRQRSGRRRQRLDGRVRSLPEEAAASADDLASRRETHHELLSAVDRLSVDDQELLRLRTWEELSLAEIATVSGLSVRAVESRLARVRKKLARSLESTPEPARRPSGPTDTQTWSSPNRSEGGER